MHNQSQVLLFHSLSNYLLNINSVPGTLVAAIHLLNIDMVK